MILNKLAWKRCEQLVDESVAHRVSVVRQEGGARLVDCGVFAAGGLEAGLAMAEICLAGLGRVSVAPGRADLAPGPSIAVQTDQPIAACMAAQYAGWQIAGMKFFAMGSGPMRAARGREELFEHIGFREKPDCAVGVLETGKLPPTDVCEHVASECGVAIENLTLLVAPTRSIAGTVQVVARSVETALHKLHTLGFELSRVVSGHGVAPLPPVACDDLTGIGRTNDAVLYGGEVTLWVRGDDDSLAKAGALLPSSASRDYGLPFGQIFERYGRDFYKIDPLLFSPAVVNFVNLDSGRSFRFGEFNPEVLAQSFGG
ncbi:MAG TPA: methenyltetrahydromethanopterin cyclohydrolase [Pirellulaceae bacterium]|nr:methenyltetrahydromethanopterin cyclohydrolase [Pirellulaceae bacterium]